MSLKHVDSAMGVLRLRQWMRAAGLTDFAICAHPHGHYNAGDIYLEIIVKEEDRRPIEEAVLLNLRKAGVFTGWTAFVPAARLTILRYGIRVKPNMKIALFGRHNLHKDST